MTILTQKMNDSFVAQHPIYQQFSQDADHIDIKSVIGTTDMNEFVANVFGYQPGWITFLYRIRWGFVRLLGMKQEGIPQQRQLQPDDLNLSVGEKIGFFTIDAVEPDSYLFTSAEESHLKAMLGIIREPLDEQTSQYYAITIVHYKSWAGPVYFNVIRPFHHLVVQQMINAGIKS